MFFSVSRKCESSFGDATLFRQMTNGQIIRRWSSDALRERVLVTNRLKASPKTFFMTRGAMSCTTVLVSRDKYKYKQVWRTKNPEIDEEEDSTVIIGAPSYLAAWSDLLNDLRRVNFIQKRLKE